jgi:hypothetical protein
MHVLGRGLVAGWGFYGISINNLRYFCKLFTLFAQKNRTVIYHVQPTRGLMLNRWFD